MSGSTERNVVREARSLNSHLGKQTFRDLDHLQNESPVNPLNAKSFAECTNLAIPNFKVGNITDKVVGTNDSVTDLKAELSRWDSQLKGVIKQMWNAKRWAHDRQPAVTADTSGAGSGCWASFLCQTIVLVMFSCFLVEKTTKMCVQLSPILEAFQCDLAQNRLARPHVFAVCQVSVPCLQMTNSGTTGTSSLLRPQYSGHFKLAADLGFRVSYSPDSLDS